MLVLFHSHHLPDDRGERGGQVVSSTGIHFFGLFFPPPGAHAMLSLTAEKCWQMKIKMAEESF